MTNFHLAQRAAGVKHWCLGAATLLSVMGAALPEHAIAQQFAGDNQWVAPHGVATIVGTVGEEYSQFYAIGALVPDWEFNLQLTHYYDDPRGVTRNMRPPAFLPSTASVKARTNSPVTVCCSGPG